MLKTAECFALDVQRLLTSHADREKAMPMAAYMKQRFPFFGIPTPVRRVLTRALFAEIGRQPDPEWLMQVAEALWLCEERECQYVAADLLVKHARHLECGLEPRLAALVCTKSWWDSVDALAARVYGDLARRCPSCLPVLDRYATDENLWLRRVAILHQLHYAAGTDLDRLSAALEANLQHPDFFIRKAMGWALRQYAKTDPDWVRAWLAQRGVAVPALTRREACKHL